MTRLQAVEITVTCGHNSLVETSFLHNAEEFLFIDLSITIPISLVNHLLYNAITSNQTTRSIKDGQYCNKNNKNSHTD